MAAESTPCPRYSRCPPTVFGDRFRHDGRRSNSNGASARRPSSGGRAGDSEGESRMGKSGTAEAPQQATGSGALEIRDGRTGAAYSVPIMEAGVEGDRAIR